MGLTNFPNGVFATPLVGAGRLADMFQSGNIFFVDGTNGSASNTGKTVDNAVALPSTAVGLATREGIIYVRPKTTTASAQTYYVDNIVIPKTKPCLSIVGAGYPGCTSSQTGVQIKPSTVTDHLIDVRGAGLLLENMRLTLTGGTADTLKCIVNAVHDTSQLYISAGLTIRGCRIENDKNHPAFGATTTTAAVGLGSCREVTIENNVFYNCLGAIAMGTTSGNSINLMIRNNHFGGVTTGRDCDIAFNLGASYNMQILGNTFADGLPAHVGGGTGRFISIVGATATGLVAGNYFASTAAAAQYGSDGTDCIIPATFFFAGNYNEDGLIAGGT